MNLFDFSDPTRWNFEGVVYLYVPVSEDHADMVACMMEEMADLNGVDGRTVDYFDYKQAMSRATKDSRFSQRGTCDHCGAHFHYGALYKSETGEVAVVGNICASNKLNLSAHEYADTQLRTLVKKARNKIAADKAMAALLPNRLADLSVTTNVITNSIRGNFRKWHSLSIKQWALIKKLAHQEEKKVEEQAAAKPIPAELLEGRHTISGVLLGLKSEPGYAWNTYVTKMLVLDDRGFKVWGTLPDAIYNIQKGDRLTFDATIEVSKRDECFGFSKRPTKSSFQSTTEEKA